ncbi:MAG TPA: response regulator [Anaerolineae bacterium]|nr:response regulator [Anaerolineae bacterium]HMR63310.1 response regulator [Anaerolineae bacterium]
MFKVLVVDDDPDMTGLLLKGLSQHNFEVITSNSSAEALDLAHRLNPDIITLDLMMPDIHGWQLCREIRAFSQVPILIISALVDSSGVYRAIDEGANDYLVKPAPIAVVVSRLNRLIRQASLS